jgi:hypothetical protein
LVVKLGNTSTIMAALGKPSMVELVAINKALLGDSPD